MKLWGQKTHCSVYYLTEARTGGRTLLSCIVFPSISRHWIQVYLGCFCLLTIQLFHSWRLSWNDDSKCINTASVKSAFFYTLIFSIFPICLPWPRALILYFWFQGEVGPLYFTWIAAQCLEFLQKLRELEHVFELKKKFMLLSFRKFNYRKVLFPLLFCEKQLTGLVVFPFLLWQTTDVTEVKIRAQKDVRI